MRNWAPYLAETLAQMAADGVRRALGLILAPHRTEASWERYLGSVDAGCAALGANAPAITYVGDWFDHPLFIDTMATRVGAALTEIGGEAHVIFTAHSVPQSMADAPRYVREYETTGRLIAAALGNVPHTFAYQSRSGSPRDPWLEPDVNDVVRACAARGVRRVVVSPIGFVCDHVEVLYDLDVEARATAAEVGVEMVRALTANDHPTFVRMLAEVVRAGIGTD
jgi:ferrochelatase